MRNRPRWHVYALIAMCFVGWSEGLYLILSLRSDLLTLGFVILSVWLLAALNEFRIARLAAARHPTTTGPV